MNFGMLHNIESEDGKESAN